MLLMLMKRLMLPFDNAAATPANTDADTADATVAVFPADDTDGTVATICTS